MKNIAILGANDFAVPLIKKAKDLGFKTHVFAWKNGDAGEKIADYFYPISVTEKEQILKKCKEIKPDAITSIASDLTTIAVTYVANELGLLANSQECAALCTNKYKMRLALKNAGISVPKFMIVDLNTDIDEIMSTFELPIIVKPTDRSGSRGITKVTDRCQLSEAILAALKQSFEGKAIIESFVEGKEYSCECISYCGKHKVLAFTQKSTTGAPHFIETGHIEPSDLSDEEKDKAKAQIFRALFALKVTFGASHSEFRVTDKGEVVLMEIGARMGGDCIGSHLVELSTGIDYLKMVIDCAIGEKPDFKVKSEPKIACIKFILSQQDLLKYYDIKKCYEDNIVYVSNIEKIGTRSVVDSSTRYGYYILKCDNKEDMRKLFNV
ncbi:MAG: ATP-grasp domain-containing protein [Oscillospiraceae bacterium]|nr:ATP-grasp domain-containing protein [Oscillospiraceae bacterium]